MSPRSEFVEFVTERMSFIGGLRVRLQRLGQLLPGNHRSISLRNFPLRVYLLCFSTPLTKLFCRMVIVLSDWVRLLSHNAGIDQGLLNEIGAHFSKHLPYAKFY